MISNRARNMTVASLVALATMLAIAPTASAQNVVDTQLKLTLGTADTAIKPLSDLAVITGDVVYTYSSNGASLIATTIQLKVTDAPAWASVTISPATIPAPVASSTPGAGSTQTTPPLPFKVLVSTTADAPAFTLANIKVSATALTNGNLKQSTAEESTPIRADFFSIIDAVPQTTIQLATPQSQVAYPVTVTNFGNAQTKVFFEITDKPASWQVVAPTPITLDAKQAGGKQTSSTVNLMIQTPFRNGYLNEVGAATMKVTSSYALDNKIKGDQTQMSTLTTTKGFYVPGFEALFVLVGLAGVALVIRRRA